MRTIPTTTLTVAMSLLHVCPAPAKQLRPGMVVVDLCEHDGGYMSCPLFRRNATVLLTVPQYKAAKAATR